MAPACSKFPVSCPALPSRAAHWGEWYPFNTSPDNGSLRACCSRQSTGSSSTALLTNAPMSCSALAHCCDRCALAVLAIVVAVATAVCSLCARCAVVSALLCALAVYSCATARFRMVIILTVLSWRTRGRPESTPGPATTRIRACHGRGQFVGRVAIPWGGSGASFWGCWQSWSRWTCCPGRRRLTHAPATRTASTLAVQD